MMTTSKNIGCIKDAMRRWDSVEEQLREDMEALHSQKEGMRQLLADVDSLQSDNEELRAQLEEAEASLEALREERHALKEEISSANVKINELAKMTNKVAAKTEHDDLVGVLRKFMNQSRRKNIQKRIYVKMFIMEIATSSGVTLPEDMCNELKSFDDEDEKQVSYTEVKGDLMTDSAMKIVKAD